MTRTPKLSAFIGDGNRTAGFEAFLNDVTAVQAANPDASVGQHQLARFMTAISIACVEIAAQQDCTTKEQTLDVLERMCLAAGVAVASAALSVLNNDVPANLLRALVIPAYKTGVAQAIKTNGLK